MQKYIIFRKSQKDFHFFLFYAQSMVTLLYLCMCQTKTETSNAGEQLVRDKFDLIRHLCIRIAFYGQSFLCKRR